MVFTCPPKAAPAQYIAELARAAQQKQDGMQASSSAAAEPSPGDSGSRGSQHNKELVSDIGSGGSQHNKEMEAYGSGSGSGSQHKEELVSGSGSQHNNEDSTEVIEWTVVQSDQ